MGVCRASRGTQQEGRAHVILLLLKKSRNLTDWYEQQGLQLSRQEDSYEANAEMLGGTEAETHESICSAKMDSNFCICLKV